MLLLTEVMLPRHDESPPPKWRRRRENLLVVFVVVVTRVAAAAVAVDPPPFSISDTLSDMFESIECLLDSLDSKDHLEPRDN